MAEYKQYITQIQENGNVMISEDVVTTIVAHALTEVDGVAGFSTKPGADVAELTGRKNWSKGMKVQIAEDNTLTVSVNIMIAYGQSVVDVAKAVQVQITNSLENRIGVKVNTVNVNVCGIVRK